MGIEKGKYLDIWRSYMDIWRRPATKDIIQFLGEKKRKAMKKLKSEDDAVARATWQLVDELYQHIEFVRKEAMKEIEENKRK